MKWKFAEKVATSTKRVLEGADVFVWVAPDEISDNVACGCVILETVESVELLKFCDGLWESTVNAEIAFVDNNAEWEVIECVIDVVKKFCSLVTGGDFFFESVNGVDVTKLMVSAEKYDILWIGKDKGKEKCYHFDGIAATVDVIAEEDDSASGWRRNVGQDANEVVDIAVNVTNDFGITINVDNGRLATEMGSAANAQIEEKFVAKARNGQFGCADLSEVKVVIAN